MKIAPFLVVCLLMSSCSSETEVTLNEVKSAPGTTETEFVVNGQAYITPNAYLLLDDAVGDYDREFSFVFTDGSIIEDAADQIAFESNTTHFTKITCNLIATVPTPGQVPIFVWPVTNPGINIIMGGNNYTHTDITSFNVTSNVGGLEYGQVEESIFYNHTAQAQGTLNDPSHVLTVDYITFDLTAGTGTIMCRYNYNDDNGDNISGVYVGDFEILTAF